jgi:predicted naringenin-chalcone synthase
VTARIIGLGTALPAHSIRQPDAAAIAVALCDTPGDQRRAVEALYRRSAVHRRSSVLLTNGLPGGGVEQGFFGRATGASDRGPSTGARSDRYASDAPALARAAALPAIEEAGVDPASITHLVTVSCTGFAAPGVDASLIARLGLRPTIARTHVGFMGCHGAINGLRVASAFARADPRAVVLLCAVELCSLHFHYTADPEKMVANALFADGAAAAIVAGAASDRAGPSIAACGSCVFPDSADAMTWNIGDFGFEMTLSPRVPDLIGEHLRPWLSAFLDSAGVPMGSVASWAIHPGGPRVLSAVANSLSLPAAAMDASRRILADHGNMSSPTVLFIIDHLRRERPSLPTPCIALAFGPGLVAEAAVLR